MCGLDGQRQQTVEAVASTGGKRGRHAALEGVLAVGVRVRLCLPGHHR
jgi:hypothetical protein